MAEHAGEPQPSISLEGISTLVPPTLTLTATVPLLVPVSHPLVHGMPLFSVGHWQTFAPLEPAIESVLVTAAHTPETLLTASSPQGYATFDTLSAAATSAIGSLPSGQPVSLPWHLVPHRPCTSAFPLTGPLTCSTSI